MVLHRARRDPAPYAAIRNLKTHARSRSDPMNRTRLAAAVAVLWCAAPAAAQQPSAVRRYVDARQHEILREFTTLLALPNVARDRAAIRRNADTLVAMLRRRGLAPRLLEAGDAAPAVYGEWLVPGATRTLVFYAHYDGSRPTRSVDGHAPVAPRVAHRGARRGRRIVDAPRPGAREPRLAAVRALRLGRQGRRDGDPHRARRDPGDRRAPTANIKLFFEGRGGGGLAAPRRLLGAHRELLAVPTRGSWCDGPVHQSGGSRWCSACAATSTSTSPSTAPRARCTRALRQLGARTRHAARPAARDP
jgi:hypothetical protein